MHDAAYARLRAYLDADEALKSASAEELEPLFNDEKTVISEGSPDLSADDFVARFTPLEFVAAKQSADPAVQQFMYRLSVRRDLLSLKSATVLGGLYYMAGSPVPGIGTIAEPVLTPERAAEIATPPPLAITVREHLKWPEARIWASDIEAARARKE